MIPLFNEQDNVRPLHARLRSMLATLDGSAEIIFVDDGSQDGTAEQLGRVADEDDSVRVVHLRHNSGQSAAMRAGIDHTTGDTIVTMDGDLQNDPRDIPLLLKTIESGYDFVTGWRKDRQDAFLSRTFPSRVANWLIARVSGLPIHDTGCSLKAYRADVIRQVPLYSEMHRFIPAMCSLSTQRFAEVIVNHHPRQHGCSKYGLSRIWKVLLDVVTVKMLISSARRPLHWFGMLAALFLCLATATFTKFLIDTSTPGSDLSIVWPVVSLLFAALALHLVFAGLFGELVVHQDPANGVSPLAECRTIVPSSRHD